MRSFSIEMINDQPNDTHYIFQWKLGGTLLKSVWETSEMKASRWKIKHPSDTEDEKNVGLSSEDKAEGLEAAPRSSQEGDWSTCSSGAPTCSSSSTSTASWGRNHRQETGTAGGWSSRCWLSFGERICLKGHRAGRWLRFLTRFPVFQGEKPPVLCVQQTFKSHHRVRVHMGVHRGEKFPCGRCGKVLASKCYWRDHTQSCMQGKTVACCSV